VISSGGKAGRSSNGDELENITRVRDRINMNFIFISTGLFLEVVECGSRS
jgi:hypothetical protein